MKLLEVIFNLIKELLAPKEFVKPVITKTADPLEVGPLEDQLKEYEKENKTKRREFVQPIQYKNKTQRLKKEHGDLQGKNNKLYKVLEDINSYTNRHFKKPILITMIYRTDIEQAYLYRNSARYKKRAFKSPHQFWHAVDLRSHTFTSAEIVELVDWINNKYDEKNEHRWTAKFHSVGTGGKHFHIQFV